MQSLHVVRVVLSGTTPLGTRERFATTIKASASEYAAGRHVERAKFHARVRGLGSPWDVSEVVNVAQL